MSDPRDTTHTTCNCVPNLGPPHCHLCDGAEWPCLASESDRKMSRMLSPAARQAETTIPISGVHRLTPPPAKSCGHPAEDHGIGLCLGQDPNGSICWCHIDNPGCPERKTP